MYTRTMTSAHLVLQTIQMYDWIASTSAVAAFT